MSERQPSVPDAAEPFTIDIARPPAEVFAFATDPAHFHEWQSDVTAAAMVTGAPDEPGSRFTTTRRIGPTERTMEQEVVEVDPPFRWRVKGVAGPIRPSASVTIEPIDDGAGSRVRFELGFDGQGIGVALLPMVRATARKAAPVSYRKLKALLEQRP